MNARYGDSVRGDVQVAGPLAADERRQQHAVAEAGYGEQFGHALQQTDYRCFRVGQVRHDGLSLRQAPAALPTSVR